MFLGTIWKQRTCHNASQPYFQCKKRSSLFPKIVNVMWRSPCGVGALWGGRHKIGNVTVSGRSRAQKWTAKKIKNLSKISLVKITLKIPNVSLVIDQWFSTLLAWSCTNLNVNILTAKPTHHKNVKKFQTFPSLQGSGSQSWKLRAAPINHFIGLKLTYLEAFLFEAANWTYIKFKDVLYKIMILNKLRKLWQTTRKTPSHLLRNTVRDNSHTKNVI